LTDKAQAYTDYKATLDIEDSEILYMGDDIPDIVLLKQAGIASCPADAAHEVIAISQYVATKNGGKGCVREVIERVMKTQGKWPG
jgi:3-deoxy-D-manno-octulosonate 8-phosphate phosphatase (KDO 8-P phosphatase)